MPRIRWYKMNDLLFFVPSSFFILKTKKSTEIRLQIQKLYFNFCGTVAIWFEICISILHCSAWRCVKKLNNIFNDIVRNRWVSYRWAAIQPECYSMAPLKNHSQMFTAWKWSVVAFCAAKYNLVNTFHAYGSSSWIQIAMKHELSSMGMIQHYVHWPFWRNSKRPKLWKC